MKTARIASRLLILGICISLPQAWGQLSDTQEEINMNQEQTLSQRQQAIIPVAASAAAGDLAKLKGALNQALDAGMTVNDGKEVLVQLYAYAGFPRSLNALGTFMRVLAERREQSIEDAQGEMPRTPIPQGDALLEQGTANQTELAGGPVKGPLFDFSPAVDEFLKTHLFGDIFARDNLSWQDREIATLAMLSVLAGTEPQLQAHVGIAMNTGLSAPQLQQLATVLAEQIAPEAAARTLSALTQYLNP